MKVYISQGHEEGIGLEVLFKTTLLMSNAEISKLELIAFPDSVTKTLSLLKFPHTIEKNYVEYAGIKLSTVWLTDVNHSESFTSLCLAMEKSQNGVLYTLPTSKDQFPGHAGHTEYFRSFYNSPELGMFFSSPSMQVLLLSDHIKISELSSGLTEDVLFQRLFTSLKSLKNWHWPIKNILVSGLNPHAGENGLLGTEENRIKKVIERLTSEYKYNITGPYPGDTMALEQKHPNDLLVYLFHDQGLGVFKSLQGFVGSNITLGLPFPRLSPDHGTSFGLLGKNQADYRGCAFSLRQAIGLLERIYGKNSSHQGQGS